MRALAGGAVVKGGGGGGGGDSDGDGDGGEDGGAGPTAMRLLQTGAARKLRLLQVGFNAGHSAATLLDAGGPDAHLVSFDLGEHPCTTPAEAHVSATYPGQHTLVLGDSQKTLPQWAEDAAAAEKRFDLCFVDGGHSFEVASSDLLNLRAYAHAGTLVVMDDITPEFYWGRGPTSAWSQAEARGDLTTLGVYEAPDAKPIRRWVVGKYLDL